MNYSLETEGGFWGSLPKLVEGNANDLPQPQQQALMTLFTAAKDYRALPVATNAVDTTKYKITLQQAGQTQTIELNDAQLKHLPGPLADAIIYLSNKAT